MAAYDGSIRIDTRIDSRGFNTGIRAMVNGVKGLAAAIGIAFGVGAVVAFGKSAVSAASEMAAAMTGLQSVVQGTGKSFSDAQKFINSYISDGLIPATNAIAAYKNLALRGYDTSQIEKVLTALKDSAAFGRQSSLTLGYAVQSATEGLKNENSILVDNAGVTKNVSMMWRDYAASIGTTSDKLTKQQKIQAEVAGILQETSFQTGDAAKLSGQYSGQVAALGTSFYNLRVAIGNSIIPIISKVMPYIKAAVDALTIFFNRVSQFMSLLFGIQIGGGVAEMEALASATSDAADAQADLSKATSNTGKAAKGALAAFDEINVLQMESGDAASGSAGAAGGGAVGGVIGDTTETEGALDSLKAKVDTFKQSLIDLFTPASEAFDRFKQSLSGLGGTIWEGLKWAWDNILIPLGKWTITNVLPAFLDLLSSAADTLDTALIALKPLGLWLWENFLQPLAEWTGGVIVDIINGLADAIKAVGDWINKHQTAFQNIVLFLGAFYAAALLLSGAIVVVTGVISTVTTVVGAFSAALAFLAANPVVLIILAIAALIAIIILLVKNWDTVKQVAGQVWDWIKQKWSEAGAWFSKTVTEPIKKSFREALDNVKEKWETTFTGIKTFVKNSINTIIDFINGMISSVAKGINVVIGGLNSLKVTIPSWVPVYGGKSWGMNIPIVPTPQIPRLATGAVIPPNAEFAAILGDQRSGRNLEAPENLIRQIIRDEVGDLGGDTNITMPVYLDGEKIAQSQKKVARRRGTSLITGGATA
jgi:hypothetical protein